jgi:flavin-dependent dehydrogenase
VCSYPLPPSGTAGATAAVALARRGFQVLLLERVSFSSRFAACDENTARGAALTLLNVKAVLHKSSRTSAYG